MTDTAWLAHLFTGYTHDDAAFQRQTDDQRRADQAAYQADQARAARDRDRTRCPKCDGTGLLPQYRHIQHGACFACGGTGRR